MERRQCDPPRLVSCLSKLQIPTVSRNEIYANSIFNPEPHPYKSLFEIGQSLNREELKDRLHLVYGLAKDFCGSGLRIGIAYTDSEPVLRRLRGSSVVTSASSPLQHHISTVLHDDQFVKHFLTENQKRLKNSYTILSSKTKPPATQRTIFRLYRCPS